MRKIPPLLNPPVTAPSSSFNFSCSPSLSLPALFSFLFSLSVWFLASYILSSVFIVTCPLLSLLLPLLSYLLQETRRTFIPYGLLIITSHPFQSIFGFHVQILDRQSRRLVSLSARSHSSAIACVSVQLQLQLLLRLPQTTSILVSLSSLTKSFRLFPDNTT